MRVRFVVLAPVLLCASGAAQGRSFEAPAITQAEVDWPAALAAVDGIDALKARVASRAPDAGGDAPADGLAALDRLNHALGALLPNLAASPVPVLLPVDVAAALGDTATAGSGDAFPVFGRPTLFVAGPAGYDAAFAIRPRDMPDLADTAFTADAEIQITGAAFLYALDAPVGMRNMPLALDAQFPGIRRVYVQSHMRYVFVRYGVSYTVSILCFDGASRARRLSCRDADPIAQRFLAGLQFAGGTPQPLVPPTELVDLSRPDTATDRFTYYATGRLIAGTGYRSHGGRDDATVYADIRFPLAAVPAHVYSQMFMFSGDCTNVTSPRTTRRRGQPFRCPDAEPAAADTHDDDAGATAQPPAIPWRDNFCEMRDFSVGQCPGGWGHQGQDIVPAACRFDGDQRCDRQQRALVAVHSGTLLRAAGQEGLVIVVNTPTAHLRFRYLHMHPRAMDEDGMVSGRVVTAGEPVGSISNFSGRDDGTSYHLHFDMQVLTRDGWILVNPYATLVSAYERLIGGRGIELADSSTAATGAAPLPARIRMPAKAAKPARAGRRHLLRKGGRRHRR